MEGGPKKFITFLSDFGHEDDFVGTCHGVIKQIAPEVEIIDITHGVPRHDVPGGALVLANTLPYMPESVILAVVDPGVGTGRRPLAMRTGEGRYLVGPDNGLLSLAAGRLGGIEAAVELACSAYSLPEVCKTFEGRDLFAPVAAHLSRGVGLEALGAPVPADEIEQLHLPEAVISDGKITATVIYIDHFGNIELNLDRRQLESAGAGPGACIEVTLGEERVRAPFVQSYADVAPEELLVYEDSYRSISFSINQGDAARTFQVIVGDQLTLQVLR